MGLRNMQKKSEKAIAHMGVTEGDIFKEQKMRFRLVLSWLAILKKIEVDYEQL